MPYRDEYPQTAPQRDQMIVEMRRAGCTYRQIAGRAHMSPAGIGYALRRIAAGRPGTNPRP